LFLRDLGSRREASKAGRLGGEKGDTESRRNGEAGRRGNGDRGTGRGGRGGAGHRAEAGRRAELRKCLVESDDLARRFTRQRIRGIAGDAPGIRPG
jgi:hypothetical protein